MIQGKRDEKVENLCPGLPQKSPGYRYLNVIKKLLTPFLNPSQLFSKRKAIKIVPRVLHLNLTLTLALK